MSNHCDCCECCKTHNHEEIDTNGHLKQLYIALIFLVAAFFISNEILKPILYIISYLIAGHNVLISSLKNIKNKKFFDENFLMSIATIGALCIKEYPEAVMVMILYLLGEYFQDKAVDKARNSISELINILPEYANIEQNGKIIQVNPKEVKIGEIILVKAGEKIPLDGIIIEGNSELDTSSLTGESIPVNVSINSEVLSGSVNISGLLRIKVTKSFENSTVSKIIELVEHSNKNKSQTENYISKFAKIYTPIVVFLALMIVIIPLIIFGYENINEWINRALTFLVISCPCAFVISVPLSFYAGIGCASRHGILIKGSNYLEQISKAGILAFDKTGTLTTGTFSVKEIIPNGSNSKEEIVELAAYAESCSNHPIAKSVVNYYTKEIDSSRITGTTEVLGFGIKAEINNNYIIAGCKKLLEISGIELNDKELDNAVYIAKNNQYIGKIIIADSLKSSAESIISELKKLSCKIVMLTGDNEATARQIAQEAGINEYYYSLLPYDKVQKIEDLINKNKNNLSVFFVGDGINDAPVIMRADTGIAMGALGSDAAIEAADIVISDDKLEKIPLAIKIAKKTMNIVKQNIAFAIIIKFLFLILGGIGLMTMWGAVFADVGVTLLAVLNSLRTLKE